MMNESHTTVLSQLPFVTFYYCQYAIISHLLPYFTHNCTVSSFQFLPFFLSVWQWSSFFFPQWNLTKIYKIKRLVLWKCNRGSSALLLSLHTCFPAHNTKVSDGTSSHHQTVQYHWSNLRVTFSIQRDKFWREMSSGIKRQLTKKSMISLFSNLY